jgi:hypothetical protein
LPQAYRGSSAKDRCFSTDRALLNIHDAEASDGKPLKVLTVYIVDKTKPLATPAP